MSLTLHKRTSTSMSAAITLASRIYCDNPHDLIGVFDRLEKRISLDLFKTKFLLTNLTSYSFVGYRSQESRASLYGLASLNLKWLLNHFTKRRIRGILSGVHDISLRSYVMDIVSYDEYLDELLVRDNESLEFIIGVYIVFSNTMGNSGDVFIQAYRKFLNEISLSPRLI